MGTVVTTKKQNKLSCATQYRIIYIWKFLCGYCIECNQDKNTFLTVGHTQT